MNMKTNSILTENGYTVEQAFSGYYRLMRGENVILDDSACEDYYCEKEDAESIFEEYLRNSAYGVFTLDALAEYVNTHKTAEWLPRIGDIVTANGWTEELAIKDGVLQDGPNDAIASDGDRRLVFNESLKAVVVDDDD